MISKQSGSGQAFITLQVDFHRAQDGGSGYFLQRRTLTFFPNLLPLLQAPLGAPCLQLGPLYTQNPPGSSRLAWDTCFCGTPLIPCLSLWLAQRLPLGEDILPPWEGDKAEERTCSHLGGAWAQQNPNPGWDAAADGRAEPSPALVHPGKIAQWFGHDKDIE